MEILAGSLSAGLLIGMVFALVALGLTIIFGVMDIVNFAHGEFLMLGMYTALLTAQATGVDPLLTIPFAGLVGFLLGVICYLGFVKYLIRGPMVAQLLGTFGLMLVLRNLALFLFGSEDRTIHEGILVGQSFDLGMGIILPATKLAAAFLSVISFTAVWLLINRTRIGKALMATALNAQGARYMGIPTERMNAFAWGIGGATVTMAGALAGQFLVGDALCRPSVYHDRLCHRGPGRVREHSRRVFRGSYRGPDYRTAGNLGFYRRDDRF